MKKLQAYEVELLQLVLEHDGQAASIIHDQYNSEDLKETIKDLGHLRNLGYVDCRYRQFSITEKGRSYLAQRTEVAEAIKSEGESLTAKPAEKVVDIAEVKCSESNIKTDVNKALRALKEKLTDEPVVIDPVEKLELKCNVLAQLACLLDPSIGSVLDDIRADLVGIEEKAA